MVLYARYYTVICPTTARNRGIKWLFTGKLANKSVGNYIFSPISVIISCRQSISVTFGYIPIGNWNLIRKAFPKTMKFHHVTEIRCQEVCSDWSKTDNLWKEWLIFRESLEIRLKMIVVANASQIRIIPYFMPSSEICVRMLA